MKLARAVALLMSPVLAVATAAVAQPANDDCANATVVTGLPFSDSVDMTTATTDAGDPTSPCFGGGQGANSVWYRVPTEAAYVLRAGTVSGSGSGYAVSVFTGGCGALVEKWCRGWDPRPPTDVAVAAEGQEVWIEVVNTGTAGTLDFALDALPEFLVAADGYQHVTVGGGPHGFLTTWLDVPKHARRFDPTGTPVGPLIPVPEALEYEPDIAGAGDGSFVIVGDSEAVRVEADDTVVPMPSVAAGEYPRVAADADGDFAVVWLGGAGQLFQRDGTPIGPAFDVTTGQWDYAAVAMAPGGNFVVVWGGADDGQGGGIGGQRFDATGSPVGPEFIVNTSTALDQYSPGVAMDAAGNFVVAWVGGGYRYPEGSAYGIEDAIVARRFAADGTPAGPEFLVTSNTNYDNGRPIERLDVDMSAAGDFMVTWEGLGFTVTDIHARRFEADGTPTGPEFFANAFDGYSSYGPDIGATPAGDFMVVWDDFDGVIFDPSPGGSEHAILGRVFPAPGLACAESALSGCRTPTVPLKAKLLIVDAPDPLHDQLRWKFVKGQATDAADLGDPGTDEDYVLCMYDASSPGGPLLMENRLFAGGTCGTKPCWKPLGNPPGAKGQRYKNKARTPHGILKMVLKPGVEGKSKVVIKGGQGNVFSGGPGVPPLPLPLPVTVQLQNRSGACWQATYDADGVGVNEAGFFKGSGS